MLTQGRPPDPSRSQVSVEYIIIPYTFIFIIFPHLYQEFYGLSILNIVSASA